MFVPLARLTRGGLAESWHLGAAAVVAPGGRLLTALGEPDLEIVLRSAAKPFQALPLLLAGGEAAFALDDADLALVCASHSGGDEHADRARSLLARGGFAPEALQCGAHPPLGAPEAAALASRGEEPTPLHNNCSGKHAGMLLACRRLDLPAASYLEGEHPLQRRIGELLATVAGVSGPLRYGVDGCSAPTWQLPLAAGARAYAALADPMAAGLPGEIAAALSRIGKAMAAAPRMVAGEGRFTTALIAATGGRVVGKEGAEGVYGVAVRGPVALGLLLKIADGGERARDTVVLELLRQLGLLSAAEMAELAPYYRPEQRNHRGLLVGEIEPDFELDTP